MLRRAAAVGFILLLRPEKQNGTLMQRKSRGWALLRARPRLVGVGGAPGEPEAGIDRVKCCRGHGPPGKGRLGEGTTGGGSRGRHPPPRDGGHQEEGVARKREPRPGSHRGPPPVPRPQRTGRYAGKPKPGLAWRRPHGAVAGARRPNARRSGALPGPRGPPSARSSRPRPTPQGDRGDAGASAGETVPAGTRSGDDTVRGLHRQIPPPLALLPARRRPRLLVGGTSRGAPPFCRWDSLLAPPPCGRDYVAFRPSSGR